MFATLTPKFKAAGFIRNMYGPDTMYSKKFTLPHVTGFEHTYNASKQDVFKMYGLVIMVQWTSKDIPNIRY